MGIVEPVPELPVLVKRFGPWAERNFGGLEIRRQRVAGFSDELAVEGVPKSLLSRNGVQVNRAVLESRRRRSRGSGLCRGGRSPAASASWSLSRGTHRHRRKHHHGDPDRDLIAG